MSKSLNSEKITEERRQHPNSKANAFSLTEKQLDDALTIAYQDGYKDGVIDSTKQWATHFTQLINTLDKIIESPNLHKKAKWAFGLVKPVIEKMLAMEYEILDSTRKD